MKDLSSLLSPERYTELFKHPYQRVVETCFNRINHDRVEAGFKPITYGRLVSELKIFGGQASKEAVLKECAQSRNFTKVFYGKLKAKRGKAQ